MSALIEVLLALLDAIKTGAQQSREPLYKFFITLSILAVFVLTLAGGIGLVLAALLLGLLQVMPVYFAALITGALSLALSGGLIWLGKARSKE